MKKRKQWIGLVLCVLLAAAAALSGCGKKTTAESLMKEVQANVEKIGSMSANMKLDMGMSVEQSGMSVDLDVNMDVDMDIIQEPMAAHMKGNVSMSLMGLSVDIESYSVVEDGKAVTYTKSMDQWTRTEAELPEENQMESIQSLFDSSVAYTLNDKLEKVDGKDVYVLRAKVSGDLMEDMMGEMSDSMGEMSGEMDWSKFSADVTMKIDKKTMLPVEMIMDCSEGMSELMESAAGGSGVAAKVDSFTLTFVYTGFDNVNEIVVPEEAKSASSDGTGDNQLDDFLGGNGNEPGSTEESTPAGESESGEKAGVTPNADGSYTLKNFLGDGSVNIGAPDGYALNPYSDETYLAFTDTNEQDFDDVYLTYRLSSDYTEEQLVQDCKDNVAYYQEDDDYTNVEMQELKKVQAGGREVSYIKVSYTFDEDSNYVEYYAWTFLDGNQVLECSIEEHAYQQECALIDEATIMETLFSKISQ